MNLCLENFRIAVILSLQNSIMALDFQLPLDLEPFRRKFLTTIQSFVRLTPEKSAPAHLWQSKIGGIPYLPKSVAYPTAPDGRELFFLLQLNFSEMPALAPFPEKGILQFYINDDDLYGMDLDEGEKQDFFRVLYFENVVEDEQQLQTNFPFLKQFDLLPHHPDRSFALKFELKEEVVPITDYRFYTHLGADFFRKFGDNEWDIMEELGKMIQSQGHKIGGYAYFTQDDPRRPEDPMLLLAQLDSDEMMDLQWGDMGVGHFFIRESDLRARDFSKVLYDWDCL